VSDAALRDLVLERLDADTKPEDARHELEAGDPEPRPFSGS
jgi:hypothetical protein